MTCPAAWCIHKLSVTERGVYACLRCVYAAHPRQADALERISGTARFVLKRRERPRSRRHGQLVDAQSQVSKSFKAG